MSSAPIEEILENLDAAGQSGCTHGLWTGPAGERYVLFLAKSDDERYDLDAVARTVHAAVVAEMARQWTVAHPDVAPPKAQARKTRRK